MDELFKKLQEAYEHATALFHKLAQERKLNDEERTENKKVKADLDCRQRIINALEEKYRYIKKVDSFHAANLEIRKDLRKQERECREKSADLDKERNILHAEVQDVKDVYEKKRQFYVTKFKELEIEKKNYKEDFQKTISQQLRDRGIKL